MSQGAIYRFGGFVLDAGERQLRHGDRPIKLNARYFDALALLAANPGALIDKDRFFAEVWAGVPVGDEALTQCMKTLRQALGDKASDPRFIETVPKHGYRFIAVVERPEAQPAASSPPHAAPAPADRPAPPRWARLAALTMAGTLGGACAALVTGVFYGALIGFGPGAPAVGGAAIFALLMLLNLAVGAAGGLGVSLGWAAAAVFAPRQIWRISAAALGGAAVGALTSVLGLDLFALLLGQGPERMTGAAEGVALGAAVALGLSADAADTGRPRAILATALACAAAGVGIVLAGGVLLAGSLDSLAASIAASDPTLDRIAPFFAAVRFDGALEALLAGIEGALFGAGLGAGIMLARRGQGAAQAN